MWLNSDALMKGTYGMEPVHQYPSEGYTCSETLQNTLVNQECSSGHLHEACVFTGR